MLTQSRLKELLHYDEETGIFTRKTKIGRYKLGSISGAKHNKGYVQIMIDGENYLAHRLAWFYVYGEFPKNQIDHINRIKTDNRIENLRQATSSQNGANKNKQINNSTGYTGVTFDKNRSKWMARIWVNNKVIHLGRFSSPIEANSAYVEASKIHHKEFSNVQQ